MFFDGDYGRQTNLVMAASMMGVIAPLVIFVIGQRHLIRGIRMGAIKG